MSKIIGEKEFGSMAPKETARQVKNGKSLLLSAGCLSEFLHAKVLGVFINLIILFVIGILPKNDKDKRTGVARKRIIRFLNCFLPAAEPKFMTAERTPSVLFFNHSSSGDLHRLLLIALRDYPTKPVAFPVDITIYEAISPIVLRLESVGIIPCPVIPMSHYVRLKLGNTNSYILHRTRIRLETNFQVVANECVKRNGVVIIPLPIEKRPTVFETVAQAKGRGVFPSQQVSSIVNYLKKHARVNYYAVSIEGYKKGDQQIERRYGSGFNLFREFQFQGTHFTTKKVLSLRTQNGKDGLEYIFFKTIAEKLPYERWHPKEE